MYRFAKNARANVSNKELQVLKLLAKQLLHYDVRALEKAMIAGELYKVTDHE